MFSATGLMLIKALSELDNFGPKSLWHILDMQTRPASPISNVLPSPDY